MRAAFVFLLMVVAASLAVYLWNGSGEPTPGNGSGNRSDAGSQPAQSAVAGGGARAVATRTEVEIALPEDLADSPTACLLVVDYNGGAPLAGAVIRRMKGTTVIGFTDEHGLAELPLKEREQLEVVAQDYLRRMAPTRLGSTVAEPQRVQLVGDRWSVRRRFELRNATDGSVIEQVFVHIKMIGSISPGLLNGKDEVERRARREDARLRGRDPRLDLDATSRRLANGEVLRFARNLPYSMEFATADGLVQTLDHQIALDEPADGRIRIELVAGDYIIGRVLGDKGRPIAGAILTRQGGDPLGLQCTTGEDGRFEFGPGPPGAVILLVRHRDHEPTALGPVPSNEKDVRITLRELPHSTLRGCVRRRPDLEPIAGATVSWSATANPPTTATTAADGTFQLAATGDIAGRLLVSAVGCIALEELVTPGAAFADYDLLPSSTAVRLEKKLTAVLCGIVLDAQSRPVANVAVQWTPNQRASGAGTLGRRTISGNLLLLPLTATTKADGSFALETHHLGTGTLSLVGHGLLRGIRTEAIAGVTKAGLLLQQR